MNWKVDGEFSELPEHLSPHYQKYMKFIKEYKLDECYDILRNNIIKEIDNLDSGGYRVVGAQTNNKPVHREHAEGVEQV